MDFQSKHGSILTVVINIQALRELILSIQTWFDFNPSIFDGQVLITYDFQSKHGSILTFNIEAFIV